MRSIGSVLVRAAWVMALTCGLLAGRAEAILVCPIRDLPTYAPVDPGPSDFIDIWAVSFVAAFPYLYDYSFMSRIAGTRPDGTIDVDVVITNRPQNFPGYQRFDSLDEPVARLAPMTVGGHWVSVTMRIGDDPSDMASVCDSPNGVQVNVVGAPGLTITAPVVEYYNAALDHYFITQDPAEIAGLDAGVHAGWRRTGKSFAAWKIQQSDRRGRPVARYYGLPSHGLDTHFFTASASELLAFMASPYFPDWQQETLAAFELALPDLRTGACLNGTEPIYRLWNQRTDSNHRYTADAATKAQMVAAGWLAEGYGPDAVAMCAPVP